MKKDLSENEKCIIKVLDGGFAFQKEIAKKVGTTRQTASKYLERLEARGIIDKRKIGNSTIYSLSEAFKLDRYMEEF